MKKDELRPCIVKIEKISNKKRSNGKSTWEVAKEVETHSGYFHAWANESYTTSGYLAGTVAGQVSSLYGVVEYEDGTVHRVPPECITFTDRECEK